MIKKWFNRVTPFVMLSVVLLLLILYFLIIERRVSEGFGYWSVLRIIIFLATVIVIDLALKYLISRKNYLIWIIEMFLCLGLLYYWIVS